MSSIFSISELTFFKTLKPVSYKAMRELIDYDLIRNIAFICLLTKYACVVCVSFEFISSFL